LLKLIPDVRTILEAVKLKAVGWSISIEEPAPAESSIDVPSLMATWDYYVAYTTEAFEPDTFLITEPDMSSLL